MLILYYLPMMNSVGTLGKEIAQRRPFRSLSQEAVLGLFRTTDGLRRAFAATLSQGGLTQQQYNVLRILRGAGEEGLPTLRIAERMVEQTPGITRLLDRLERQGWVVRRRTPEDRRCVRCTITADGLEVLEGLDEPMNELDDAILNMLSEAEIRSLIVLLDKIRAADSSSPDAAGCRNE